MDFGILNIPYQSDQWLALMRYLFGDAFQANLTPIRVEAQHERIQSFVQNGVIQLNDIMRTRINVYAVVLQPGLTKVHRNRVMLATIIENIRSDAAVAGALAAFADPGTGKWRMTLVAKRDAYTDDGSISTQQTEAKRFTYLLGKDENTRTARQRFEWLAGIKAKRLEDVLEAFSVEKISNEFFTSYKEQYRQFCEYLYTYEPAVAIFKGNQKLLRDFAKKLLGRLVFLYFLQKKRWIGGLVGVEDWEDGISDFIRQLFEKSEDKNHFYSQTLAPLYFKTLNTGEEERPGFSFDAPWGKVKVPFLNGGLFEEDQKGTELFDFPELLFKNLLDLFDRYNFTVDENSPNDHEVGIDPEMLGHIFENLLEENREKKGAFYTPKEIVHYLCQESLWQYLKTNLLGKTQPANVIWSDSRELDERELEQFVRNKERGPKDGFIYKNARAIEKALTEVRICDPAIGSGAFPMGLLYEIFYCHVELDLTKNLGKLKRDIIEHCIYGIDIDKGAVDIAQLRFWLALVVDETTPKPLPNLDYKIMQGDSLLEHFEATDLSRLMSEEDQSADNGPLQGSNLFMVAEASPVFNTKEKTAIRKLLHDYYVAQSKERKKDLLFKINKFVLDKVDRIIFKEKETLLFEKSDIKKEIERQLEFKRDPANLRKSLAKKEEEIVAFEQRRERLHECLSTPEKPFFLWHLYFDEVLREHGGFDIIIGNPPYVQIQSLKDDYKKWLEQEGYTTFDKGSDLYALFYERGWNMLKPGGHLAFITSNKWMRANYGQGLRRFFIEKTNPLKLLDFGMAQNFASALTYTSIVIFQKNKPDHQIEICRAQADYQRGADVHQYFQSHRTNIPDLGTGSWVAYTPDEYRIKKIVEAQGVPLGKKEDYWEKRISINRGVLTGFNDAFILKTYQKDEILARERELTGGSTPSEVLFKKMLRGEDVRAWAPQWNELWLIDAHNGVKSLGIPRVNVEKDFPGVFEWLSKKEFYPTIQNRTDQGDHWTNLRNCAYWQDFSKPKIIYPNLTKYLPFAYDLGVGYFSNDKSFILTGENIGYLACVFNSKLFKFCFRQNFPELLGETFEVRKVFFDKIPIKVPGAAELAVFEPLASYLALLHHLIRTEKNTPLEIKQWAEFFEYLANGLVYELYFGEAMRAAGRDLMRYLPTLPVVSIQPEHRAAALHSIDEVFAVLSERTHPVATNLYYMTVIPDIQVIERLKTEVKA